MRTLKPVIYIIVMSLLCFITVQSLDCYQCSNSDEDSCTATTTCSTGQVCSNKVFKRYTLTTVFDKGCMAKGGCNSLEDLNTDRYCSVTPSTCMYCCGSDLCNGAESYISLKATRCWRYSIVSIAALLRFYVL